MQMHIAELEGGVKQVSLVGRLDVQGTAAVEDSFAFNVATEKAAVLVDMAKVDFIASIGLRMLLANARALANRGGKMALLNPTAMVESALEMAGVTQLVPVFNDIDVASAALLADIKG